MGERSAVVCGSGLRGSVELRPRAPYAFAAALAYLATSPSAVLERVDTRAGVYRRAVSLGGHELLVTLRSTGTVEQPRLALQVQAADGERLGHDALERAERFARRVFLLDEDAAT